MKLLSSIRTLIVFGGVSAHFKLSTLKPLKYASLRCLDCLVDFIYYLSCILVFLSLKPRIFFLKKHFFVYINCLLRVNLIITFLWWVWCFVEALFFLILVLLWPISIDSKVEKGVGRLEKLLLLGKAKMKVFLLSNLNSPSGVMHRRLT